MTEWHGYAHGGQARAVALLVLASVALAAAWNWLQTALVIQVPWWLDTPAVLGFYGFLYGVFDRWAWGLFRVLHGVPDYSGDYDVTFKSSHDGHAKEGTGKIKIRQRWSRMVVRLETAESGSISQGGYLVEAPGEGHRLVYLFHNTPKGHAAASMQQHDGTAQLVFGVDGKSAKGLYYTGRGRLQHGEIVLRKAQTDTGG